MAPYLESNNIMVFPSTTREASIASNGQYLTEYNLTNIINRLTDRAAFVISNSFNSSSNQDFEFNIYGYYFSIPQTALNDLIKENIGTYVIASIKIYLESNHMITILGTDTDNSYEGLNIEFVSTLSDVKNLYASPNDIFKELLNSTENNPVIVSLPLFYYDGANASIPWQSKVAFNSGHIHIDDGEL